MANGVISWPSLAMTATMTADKIQAAIAAMSESNLRAIGDIGASAALYASTMLSSYATRCVVVAPPAQVPLTPHAFRAALPVPLRRRLEFVDRKGALFGAIVRYLTPIREYRVNYSRPRRPEEQIRFACLEVITAGLYELCLAMQHDCDASIDTPRLLYCTKALFRCCDDDAECIARLTVIRSIFMAASLSVNASTLDIRSYNYTNEIPALLEELLDDAEFLNASAIRTFFRWSSNKRSLQRDLRKITDAIARRPQWARLLTVISRPLATVALNAIGDSAAAAELLRVFRREKDCRIVVTQPKLSPPSLGIIRLHRDDEDWWFTASRKPGYYLSLATSPDVDRRLTMHKA